MGLLKIQSSVQEVAEAISTVLNVDVTIIDHDLRRIAATGIYRESIGEKIPRNCSFEGVARTKEPEFIDNPNYSQKCSSCSLKGNCAEMATIGYPMLSNGKLLGVIGLIAFNREQKEKIHSNYDSLIVFLSKLGDLLVGNLKYNKTITELTIQGEERKKIIDGLDNGVIGIDNKGKIKFVNSKIEEYFQMNSTNLINNSIHDIIPNIDLSHKNSSPIEKKITVNKKRKSFLIREIPIIINNKKVSNIIEVYKTSDMVKTAYTIIEGEKNISFDNIIGKSKEILAVKDMSYKVAKSDSTVLIQGESGTGKELFARSIHNASNRRSSPFIAINCATIPDNLLESELFGYEGGSFTGAKKEGQMGKLELAQKGTLFLDEIGDMPLHLQPKLLRVLQDQGFRRIGGKELIKVDFRLIVATNKVLEQMVDDGEFREDLYYRLNVIPIHIPPLRERKDDIAVLSQYELERYCIKLGRNRKYFSREVENVFKEYNWPGNVRELENIVEYLVNIVKGEEITYDDLPINVKKYFTNKKLTLNQNQSLKNIVDNYEKKVLESYLKKYGKTTKDKELIASLLDINLSTLYRKLGKYNLQ
ncbi:MAG TPA: sigma 54-interacting transcriptional regulator [Tissierellales bacterium]|nr:sigma 54-interacting transcriptional regulator [Tissierellales bacterium]